MSLIIALLGIVTYSVRPVWAVHAAHIVADPKRNHFFLAKTEAVTSLLQTVGQPTGRSGCASHMAHIIWPHVIQLAMPGTAHLPSQTGAPTLPLSVPSPPQILCLQQEVSLQHSGGPTQGLDQRWE